MSETLLDKAKSNLNMARVLFRNVTLDKSFLNGTSYHLQQATELALKHLLEISGIKYIQTHDIEELVNALPEEYLGISNDILTVASRITSWESKPRYIKNYCVSRDAILRTKPIIEEFITKIDELEYSVDILSDNLKDMIWDNIPSGKYTLYGTSKDEIIINFYNSHKELFEGVEL